MADAGELTIRVEGTQGLRLHFSGFQVGYGEEFAIRSADDSQTFTQDQLEAWQGARRW